MSMNSTGIPGDDARATGPTKSATEAEGSLFSPVPAWERGKKRRKFGRGQPVADSSSSLAEPRSFDSPMDAPMTAAQPNSEVRPMMTETRPMMDRWEEPAISAAASTDPVTGAPDANADLVAPIGRQRAAGASARKSGAPVAAIALGVLALGAVGTAGWYASQQDRGVAELTPGTPGESEGVSLAQAPSVPAAATSTATTTANTASTAAPAPEAPVSTMRAAAPAERRAATTTRTARVSRARPAAAPAATSAGEVGIDASGTAALPGGPQPYSALNPGASTAGGATGASGLTTAPQTATPAPMPSTPPIAPAPSAGSSPTPPASSPGAEPLP